MSLSSVLSSVLNKIYKLFFIQTEQYLTMELPDDVLQIVREYSKPVFKHYQVYNHAMEVLGVYGMSEFKFILYISKYFSKKIIALSLAYYRFC